MNQTRNIIKETLKDFVEEKKNSVEFLIEELVNELNFHKKFLTAHIQLKENFVNKLTYLEKYRKNLVEGLHGDSSIILEVYSQNFNRRIINESVYNFESEIDRFNQFIINLFLNYTKRIKLNIIIFLTIFNIILFKPFVIYIAIKIIFYLMYKFR